MSFFYNKEEIILNKGTCYERTKTETHIHWPRIIGCGVGALLAGGILLSTFTVVSAGHTGVVSTFGQVSEDVLQEGFHFKAPWQRVTKMDNRIVKLEVSTEAFSSDLQTVSVNLAVNYRVDTSMSYSIVKNVGTQYEDVMITPAVNEVMKSIMAQYTAEQSITNRNIISAALLEELNAKLSDSGIHVSDINIIDFDFSDVYVAAIESKQVAEQEKLRAEIEQKQLTMEKEAEADRKVIPYPDGNRTYQRGERGEICNTQRDCTQKKRQWDNLKPGANGYHYRDGIVFRRPAKPGLGGVADGLPYWMDEPLNVPRLAQSVKDRVRRLKCLGNAVVPQQFYPIFRAIADIEKWSDEDGV